MAAHSFQHFLRLHPELNKLANSLIEETNIQDITALSVSGSGGAAEGELSESSVCDPMDARVFERNGAVLGRRTIIKSEYWTPSEADSSDGRLHHYRHVPQMPLTAAAQPNVTGIRRILSELSGEVETRSTGNSSVRLNAWSDTAAAITPRTSSPSPQPNSPTIVWINLREEPVLFLQAEPFLLRDYLHPFRILSEFTTGMTPARCEQIEDRFKADVLSRVEAQREWRAAGTRRDGVATDPSTPAGHPRGGRRTDHSRGLPHHPARGPLQAAVPPHTDAR